MSALAASLPYFNTYLNNIGLWYYFLAFSWGLIANIAGVFLFLFFLRLLAVYFWSRKIWSQPKINLAEVKKIAAQENKPLPFFTILVPARDESMVIKSAILSYLKINYPFDRFELVVITDEKERRAKKANEITTQAITEETKKELFISHPSFNLIHLEVPYDFDGQVDGQCLGYEVKSTKGRAINWALSGLNRQKSDFCAIFDTDAQCHPDVFLAIAKEYLLNKQKAVFQLPVFQCRNFWSISIFSKIVSLGQAFTHECFLPAIMKFIPFLGGTNLYIKTDLLYEVGGFNSSSITEDLALGVSLYLKTKHWPVFLPYPSSEQTPATIKAYFRQRFRWGLGQLKLIDELKKMAAKSDLSKIIHSLRWRLILNGPAEWVIYFVLTLISSFILISRLFQGIFVIFNLKYFTLSFFTYHTFNELIYLLFSLAGIPLLLFSGYLMWRYRRFIIHWPKKFKAVINYLWHLIATLFLMPFVLFLYPLPFVWALIYHLIKPNQEVSWVKTPRTQEAPVVA